MNLQWITTAKPRHLTRLWLLSAASVLSACQPQLPETVRSGLVYCSEGSPESFNPQLVTSGTTIDAST